MPMVIRVKGSVKPLYMVDTTPSSLGKFTAAYILVSSNGRGVVVDPGPANGVDKLLKALEELNVNLVYVIPTHVHLDHVGATAEILEEYPEAVVLVHPKGAPHLIEPEKLWIRTKLALEWIADAIGVMKPIPSERVKATEDGQRIAVDDIELMVLHTPGHASHHQVVWWPEERVVFPGDAVNMAFGDVWIPATPPPFKRNLYLESFQRVKALKPRMLANTHYGVFNEAEQMLAGFEEQLKLWLRIVDEEVSKGAREVEEVYPKIVEADWRARKADRDSFTRILAKLGVKGMLLDALERKG